MRRRRDAVQGFAAHGKRRIRTRPPHGHVRTSDNAPWQYDIICLIQHTGGTACATVLYDVARSFNMPENRVVLRIIFARAM